MRPFLIECMRCSEGSLRVIPIVTILKYTTVLWFPFHYNVLVAAKVIMVDAGGRRTRPQTLLVGGPMKIPSGPMKIH